MEKDGRTEKRTDKGITLSPLRVHGLETKTINSIHKISIYNNVAEIKLKTGLLIIWFVINQASDCMSTQYIFEIYTMPHNT